MDLARLLAALPRSPHPGIAVSAGDDGGSDRRDGGLFDRSASCPRTPHSPDAAPHSASTHRPSLSPFSRVRSLSPSPQPGPERMPMPSPRPLTSAKIDPPHSTPQTRAPPDAAASELSPTRWAVTVPLDGGFGVFGGKRVSSAVGACGREGLVSPVGHVESMGHPVTHPWPPPNGMRFDGNGRMYDVGSGDGVYRASGGMGPVGAAALGEFLEADTVRREHMQLARAAGERRREHATRVARLLESTGGSLRLADESKLAIRAARQPGTLSVQQERLLKVVTPALAGRLNLEPSRMRALLASCLPPPRQRGRGGGGGGVGGGGLTVGAGGMQDATPAPIICRYYKRKRKQPDDGSEPHPADTAYDASVYHNPRGTEHWSDDNSDKIVGHAWGPVRPKISPAPGRPGGTFFTRASDRDAQSMAPDPFASPPSPLPTRMMVPALSATVREWRQPPAPAAAAAAASLLDPSAPPPATPDATQAAPGEPHAAGDPSGRGGPSERGTRSPSTSPLAFRDIRVSAARLAPSVGSIAECASPRSAGLSIGLADRLTRAFSRSRGAPSPASVAATMTENQAVSASNAPSRARISWEMVKNLLPPAVSASTLRSGPSPSPTHGQRRSVQPNSALIGASLGPEGGARGQEQRLPWSPGPVSPSQDVPQSPGGAGLAVAALAALSGRPLFASASATPSPSPSGSPLPGVTPS
jgi:hypothetical protein